jgi:hypothetical protein
MMLLLVLFQFIARSQVTARSPRPELAGSFYDALTSEVLTIAWVACGAGGLAVVVGAIVSSMAAKKTPPPPPPQRRAHFSH